MLFKLLAPAGIGHLVFILIVGHQLVVSIRVGLIFVLGDNQLDSRRTSSGVAGTEGDAGIGHELCWVARRGPNIRHLPKVGWPFPAHAHASLPIRHCPTIHGWPVCGWQSSVFIMLVHPVSNRRLGFSSLVSPLSTHSGRVWHTTEHFLQSSIFVEASNRLFSHSDVGAEHGGALSRVLERDCSTSRPPVVLDKICRLEHGRRQPKPLVQINYEQNGKVGDFDNRSVEPNKVLQGHAITQRHQQPGKYVAGCYIRKEGVVLDHGNGVDCKNKPAPINFDTWEEQVAGDCTYWCSSVALEAIAMNEFVKTVIRMVLDIFPCQTVDPESQRNEIKWTRLHLHNQEVTNDEEYHHQYPRQPVVGRPPKSRQHLFLLRA